MTEPQKFRDRVLYSVDNRVATITLDRAEKMNAFDGPMYEGVNDALIAFRDNDDAWVAIIQASGDRAFSAGADVDALTAAAEQGITTGLGGLLLDNSMVTDKPLIAAVHGYCVGEGVNLMLNCDVVFADENAQCMISEVRIGVNPVDIPLKLARRIGYAQAYSFLAPGDAKDAEWLQRSGIAEHVSPAGRVQEDARAFADRLVQECAPLALRAQKATLWEATFGDEARARDDGNTRRTMIRQSQDYAEGRLAFKEKRKPEFTGR